MDGIKTFTNKEFGTVRTIVKDGEPWFVGKDVAEILGYTKARNAIARHVDDDDSLERAFLRGWRGESESKRASARRFRARTFTQIPHPMQSSSESTAILLVGATSMHSLPIRTTGQLLLHSWRHLFGLHLSVLTMAIRVCLSVSSAALFFDMVAGLQSVQWNLQTWAG